MEAVHRDMACWNLIIKRRVLRSSNEIIINCSLSPTLFRDHQLVGFSGAGLRELRVTGVGGLNAVLLPSLAMLTRLTAVELAACRLAAFSPLLCSLPDLALLSLADNQIQVGPRCRKWATQSRSLQITDIYQPMLGPVHAANVLRKSVCVVLCTSNDCSGYRKNVQPMHFPGADNLRMQDVPAAVGQLSSLTRLVLGRNRLIALPPQALTPTQIPPPPSPGRGRGGGGRHAGFRFVCRYFFPNCILNLTSGGASAAPDARFTRPDLN